MNDYELVTILNGEIKDEDVEDTVERINQFITNRGGEVQNIDQWGRRRLAYPIARQFEGTYVVTHLRLPPANAAELEANLRISEDVLRHLLVRYSPAEQAAAIAAAQRRRPRPFAEEGGGEPASADASTAGPSAPSEAPVAEPAAGTDNAEAPVAQVETTSEAPVAVEEAAAAAPDSAAAEETGEAQTIAESEPAAIAEAEPAEAATDTAPAGDDAATPEAATAEAAATDEAPAGDEAGTARRTRTRRTREEG